MYLNTIKTSIYQLYNEESKNMFIQTTNLITKMREKFRWYFWKFYNYILSFSFKKLEGVFSPHHLIGTKYISVSKGTIIFDSVSLAAWDKAGSKSYTRSIEIGANAVVTKDVPANCIVGGVPAKIIREIK